MCSICFQNRYISVIILLRKYVIIYLENVTEIMKQQIDRLKNLREEHKMTQKQIAEYLHVSQRSYSHYENGTRSIPVSIISDLAQLYEVNIEYMLGETDVKERFPEKYEN